MSEWIKKNNKIHTHAAFKRFISDLKTQTFNEGMQKDV